MYNFDFLNDITAKDTLKTVGTYLSVLAAGATLWYSAQTLGEKIRETTHQEATTVSERITPVIWSPPREQAYPGALWRGKVFDHRTADGAITKQEIFAEYEYHDSLGPQIMGEKGPDGQYKSIVRIDPLEERCAYGAAPKEWNYRACTERNVKDYKRILDSANALAVPR
jgi:hypothetical protein